MLELEKRGIDLEKTSCDCREESRKHCDYGRIEEDGCAVPFAAEVADEAVYAVDGAEKW